MAKIKTLRTRNTTPARAVNPIAEMEKLDPSISDKLKEVPEQQLVVGPLVQYLVDQGWSLGQIIFGKKEWLVPKSPSEQTKREKGRSYNGFPVDIAVFDSTKTVGDPRHLLFVIECKQPGEQAGVSQLEAYFVGEPHIRLGIWANTADPSAQGAFIYRNTDGRVLLKRRHIKDLPRPGEAIKPDAQRISFNDLIAPTEHILRKVIEDILDKVVIVDNNVTRREEQLDQLCNILLLKLESDKQGKSSPTQPVFFRTMESATRTAEAVKERYTKFVELYPETFTTDQDKRLRFGNETIASCVEALSGLRLIDLGVSTVSVAFQVLRSEALKQGEGQYFTPNQVIQAGVRLMQIKFEDIVIDPACGTGGFLVEAMLDMKRQNPSMPNAELSRWAQTHIYGIEKDAIGLKLTKAIMQIAGDGSAHCVRGDSVRIHNWGRDFPHLNDGKMRDGRFSVVVTNPPFGQNLKVSATDSRLSELDIAKRGGSTYTDLEIGLIFLERAYQLLRKGGRVGIVLPETYFFSSNYSFLMDWIKPRLRPVVVANVPMEAFQGFCRAKTNFYVFEKIG
ncbi:MAG: class I SAM-dependent DNA methyltransferase [Blastocatellales bacterium]